ncbi:MAG: hypothetical protein J1F23_05735 [Oscillospiraceae bacterium]|nr:hypothetical protein [Oscillospiraceae bacterium]
MKMNVQTVKKIMKVVPFITAAAGVLSLALTIYEEQHGDYSREFPEAEQDIKNAIDKVKGESVNE